MYVGKFQFFSPFENIYNENVSSLHTSWELVRLILLIFSSGNWREKFLCYFYNYLRYIYTYSVVIIFETTIISGIYISKGLRRSRNGADNTIGDQIITNISKLPVIRSLFDCGIENAFKTILLFLKKRIAVFSATICNYFEAFVM